MVSQTLAIELHPSETVLDGWVHAFGVYYPRRNVVEHRNSLWSKAVILAKRKNESIIEQFGGIIATHLEPQLHSGNGYVITPVPGDPTQERSLFRRFERTTTEILADCIRDGLAGKVAIRVENFLVQVRTKAKRQHQCLNTAERAANVRGLYAIKSGAVLSGDGVILVDDVITSGATMAECAKVLRQAGTMDVIGVALAITVRFKPPEFHSESFIGNCA